MTNASDAWAELSLPWQIAFEEAWMSWVSGSAGVGSVVIDADGEIVSRGRSRVFDAPDGSSPLAGTFMAHAEMNALANLPVGKYVGYSLLTTFEPCLMCAGTLRIYRIPHVAFASDDPVWDGLYEIFSEVPAIAAVSLRALGSVGRGAHLVTSSTFHTCSDELPTRFSMLTRPCRCNTLTWLGKSRVRECCCISPTMAGRSSMHSSFFGMISTASPPDDCNCPNLLVHWDRWIPSRRSSFDWIESPASRPIGRWSTRSARRSALACYVPETDCPLFAMWSNRSPSTRTRSTGPTGTSKHRD